MSFKRLDPEDFVVSIDSLTGTVWTNGGPTLASFFTSSVQAAGSSGNFYLSVYGTSSSNPGAEVEFDIVYADSLGSGSALYNNAVTSSSPTRTMYGSYRSLILEDENANFIFGSSATLGYNACGTLITSSTAVLGDHFWVLSLERARYKQQFFAGSLNLQVSASNGLVHLTDNSRDLTANTFIGGTRVFQLVSGSNGSGIANNGGYTPNSGSYGMVFPDLGLIMLNPYALSESIHLAPSRSSDSDGLNTQKMYNAISLGASFTLNSEETISSDYVFIRARNGEFNYSENPSFISGSTGEVIYPNFINAPQTYITTVGMYNDANELVAVAKMSRPLLKDFTKEALVRVKLDF
tara:strand:+ start:15661 stop:16713 length:1053 start_codon:yes stop_codon:yes gene_type:complete